MKAVHHHLALRFSAACAGAWLVCAMGLGCLVGAEGEVATGDQGRRESTGSDLLVEELQFAVETAHRRIEALEKQLEGSDQPGNRGVAASLAAANREAEQYRVRYRDLLVRVESLGLATIRSDRALEDRMIKAVRERQHYVESTQESQEQIMRLSEAVVDYLKVSTGSNPEVRLRLESELRRADEVLGLGQVRRVAVDGSGAFPEGTANLGDGHVVGFKAELKLAVIDIGSRSGVKVGMPLNIVRKDRLVGTALVVDVRDTVSGALVQEYFREGDRVEIRDRVEPRTIATSDL
ncbi:MAG: hypothetical protein DVB23_003077 [Verrucomicrobia bacterium]|nr:MAG: hypothetical protein DVB23_003077 [Verrucomicrobiota bacterium]